MELAYQNAKLVLRQDKERIQREEGRTIGAVKEIAQLLNMRGINRIEAFDISNISGFQSVGSMVVYEKGKPKRSDYRKFRIQSVEGPNDYASMEEVLTRRFVHGMNEQEVQSITQIYTFEPLTGSIDIDNTYQIEVKAKDKPKPPKPPNIQEPIYVTGKYGIEMNPYFTPGDIGRTLYLNDKWDIFSDASGQIALVSGAYAIAQNAANAVRLFKNDAYLAQTRGIPHFEIELGKAPAIAAPILRTRIRETVLNVNGVTGAEVDLTFDESGRVMGGEVQATVLESENVQIDF